MSQVALFTVAPYVAVALLVLGALGRLVVPGSAAAAERAQLLFGGSKSWLLGISVIAAGNLGVLVLSRQILWWNENPTRRLLLEVLVMACASFALAGLASNLWARRSRLAERLGALDAVFVTTIVTWLVSGVALALLHRWVSSWSMTTVVPYIQSLFRLAPEAERIVDLPFLLRLHLLSAFVLVAVGPFTCAGVALSGAAADQEETREAHA